jgi:hypothetical protein
MNLFACDLKSSPDKIKVKRKLAPEPEESEEEDDSDSGESEVDRPTPVSKVNVSDGYTSFAGAKRCVACVKADHSACKVNTVGFSKLEGWARGIAKGDPTKGRRPPNSSCLRCSKDKKSFCHFPVTTHILGDFQLELMG